jgi:hypothetical protein
VVKVSDVRGFDGWARKVGRINQLKEEGEERERRLFRL